jgi:pre-mRNA-splicing factor CDC5/CEF1
MEFRKFLHDYKVFELFFQAEELIKREMITMLHYDAVYSPPVIPAEAKKRGQVTSQAQHLAYLEQHPYETYNQEQVAQVCNFLSQTKPYNTDVNCYITTL